jgi:hypothetical protein
MKSSHRTRQRYFSIILRAKDRTVEDTSSRRLEKARTNTPTFKITKMELYNNKELFHWNSFSKYKLSVISPHRSTVLTGESEEDKV